MTTSPAWHARPWQALAERLQGGALAHALLLVGPARLGKRDFAARLLRALLCRDRRPDGDACGRCRDCVLLAAGTHPDIRRVELGLRDDGRPRTEIVIEQIRELGEFLALTPQRGGAQVALIDPADHLNVNAANALLKTLEEPAAGRFLVLVADQPTRLPATVRSRCMRFEFRLPARHEAMAWLQGEGIAAEAAAQALDSAAGNPGLARAMLEEGLLELREAVARDLGALAGGRAPVAAVAKAWADDRPDLRLAFAAELASLRARDHALTDPALFHKLERWFDRAGRAREWVPTPVRTDLVLTELLVDWPRSAA
ncbi:MAG TPA: DNA polymerase III subunit delta' [Xanthomonadaceae bacterium]|nr:DNA polymerase III subunit delta' [Xanthomonadaceae bacterium]